MSWVVALRPSPRDDERGCEVDAIADRTDYDLSLVAGSRAAYLFLTTREPVCWKCAVALTVVVKLAVAPKMSFWASVEPPSYR